MDDLDGSRSRENGLKLHKELLVLPEKFLNKLEHLRPTEDLLRVHVEALEELGPSTPITGGGGHNVADLVEELALNTRVVHHRGGGVERRVVGVARLLILVDGLGHVDDLLIPVVAVMSVGLPLLNPVTWPAVISSEGLLHVLLLAHVEVVLVSIDRMRTKVALTRLAAHLRVGGCPVESLLRLLLNGVGEKVGELLEKIRVVGKKGGDLEGRAANRRVEGRERSERGKGC